MCVEQCLAGIRHNMCKSLQSCPPHCNAMDCNLLGSSIHGVSRQEYWNGLSCPPPGESSQPRDQTCLSCLLYWQTGFFTTSATWETHLFQVLALSASMSVIRSSKVFTSNSICFREEEKPPHNSPPCCSGCSHLRAFLLAIPFAGELPSPPNPL